jgi:tRNA1Val (adenine37-N6)-methyltransferase
MGRNNYFAFKQFTILQEVSAMKVGIDSVLLGAWTETGTAANILDVGTGTGLLALMMAQRSDAFITAVEIDQPAANEAIANINNSPWKNRIELVNTSFQHFCDTSRAKFDLIISNPPYFSNSSKPGDPRRKDARHDDQLPFSDLIDGSLRILTETGTLSVILPVAEAEQFLNLARDKGLYLFRSTRIRHRPGKPPHRRLLQFSTTSRELEKSFLTIQNQNDYTYGYKQLTKDFYLAF